jgi:hypothetical protein
MFLLVVKKRQTIFLKNNWVVVLTHICLWLHAVKRLITPREQFFQVCYLLDRISSAVNPLSMQGSILFLTRQYIAVWLPVRKKIMHLVCY